MNNKNHYFMFSPNVVDGALTITIDKIDKLVFDGWVEDPNCQEFIRVVEVDGYVCKVCATDLVFLIEMPVEYTLSKVKEQKASIISIWERII